MAWRGSSNAVGELRRLWNRWTRVIALFAYRRPARRWVDPQAYVALHTELLEGCRSLAEMVDEEERVFFQDLEYLVRPWVSIQSFKLADREILADLLAHCRQVERELGGRSWLLPDLRRPARLFSTLTVWGGLLFLVWVTGEAWLPILDGGRTWSEAIQLCIERTHYVHNLLVPAVIVVSASTFLISRTARS